jgi:hypothetical protein
LIVDVATRGTGCIQSCAYEMHALTETLRTPGVMAKHEIGSGNVLADVPVTWTCHFDDRLTHVTRTEDQFPKMYKNFSSKQKI